MQLADYLDDLTVRFLINGPYSELSSVSRICFQLEEAQWYYEDFVRPSEAAKGNHLPHLTLQDFCLAMMKACPFTNMFTEEQHLAAYTAFLEYKIRIPVRGAVLLDDSMENVVLVKGYKKGANWSFPRGKINQDEEDLDCAIREVFEETGFDIRAAGVMPGVNDYVDITMREQHLRLYIVKHVPLDTHFETRTRKEISKIAWWRLKDLPGYVKKAKTSKEGEHGHIQASKFYMVAPILGQLKKWISIQRRGQHPGASETLQRFLDTPAGAETDDGLITDYQSNEKRAEELKQLLNIGIRPQVAQLTEENLEALADRSVNSTVPGGYQEPAVHQHVPHYQQQSQERQFVQQGPHQDPFAPQAPFPYGPPPGVQQYQNGQLNHSNAFNVPPFQQLRNEPSHLMPIGYPHIGQQTFQQQVSQGYTLQQRSAGAQPLHNSYQESMQAAPRAEELPAPKLNPHAMSLLAAFKQGNVQQAGAAPRQPAAPPNTHQARLLDLFKSPAATPAVAAKPTQTAVLPPSVPVPKKTETPPPTVTTSLNQFTRTLSAKPQKVKQAPVQVTPVPVSDEQTLNANLSAAFGNALEVPQVKASAQNGKHVKTELQNAHARKATSSPRHRNASHSPAGSVSKTTKAKAVPEPVKVPIFTILTRPESAKETPAAAEFKPQVLKRPSDDSVGGISASPGTTEVKTPQQDHLLALFGKGRSTRNLGRPAPQPQATVPATKPITIDLSKPVTILRHASPDEQTPPKIPDAPLLAPEQRPSKLATTPQNNLLSLFKSNVPVSSPETPISPFALGSPNVTQLSQQQQQQAATASVGFTPMAGFEKRPEMKPERKPSNSATPTEAKGFLLGFLNDVVQKEGRSS